MTTKAYWTLGSLLLSAAIGLGQNVGIGTATPHGSARLHIEDTQRGLLIPNVALVSTTDGTTPISGPATSLLVYNTATSGTPPTNVWPGYYYWDGSRWVRLLGGSGTSGDAWLLTGNSGTNPTTNFLGTTDNVALEIRVNNARALRIEPGSSPNLIGGFSGNSVTGGVVGATIGGGGASGNTNRVTDNYGTVGGGADNQAGDNTGITSDRAYATVGGGYQNTAGGYSATVGGGAGNDASGYSATVGGGAGNDASGYIATVGGGYQNTAGGYSATVGGGAGNDASGYIATVGGGAGNTASNYIATVGGGEGNTASNYIATVGGGYQNTAGGYSATVGGGYQNTASGYSATVGGGNSNTASGNYSVVPGGYSNTANGAHNLVFGENVDPSVTETHRVYFFGDGSTSPSRPSGFLVINRLDGDYPIHVGTNNTNGNGAHLTTGGTWTNGSSRSFKERFVQYRPAEVLAKIRQLPVEGYFYKGTEEYHITPMAEDFHRLFGTGVHEIIETDSTGQLVRRPNPEVDKYLAASDVAGVALLGIKALAEENERLRQENAELRARVERLEKSMEALLGSRAASP